MKQIYVIFSFFIGVSSHVCAQQISQQQIAELSRTHFAEGVTELREILSIPNNASYPAHVQANVAWCEQAFEKRDFETKLLPTDGPPLLLV